MRGSLDKRDAPAARALDEELRRSATEASMARSRITAEELEDLRLSYDIPSSVSLRTPGPEERADDPPEGYVAIYEPAMQQGLRLSMHPFFREKWGTATDSPNKVHNWEERFFFVGGDWEFITEDPLLHVSIPHRFGELGIHISAFVDFVGKVVRNSYMLVLVLTAFRFKGVPVIRLARPASGEGSSAHASRQEALGPSLEAQDAAPSSTIAHPRPEVDANVLQRPPSSSNLHIDSTTLRDKGKKVVERNEEAPSQKRKAPAAMEGLMHDARKVRRTEEGCRSSPSLDGKPEGAENSTSSAGQNRRIRISKHRKELPASVMEMRPAHPSIVAASVHRYWTSSWEKVAEEVTVLERLQLAEKLTEDLKVMGLEKAQLESDKRAFQFKLDLVVSKETDMKAKYEIELMAAKECLKQARDQRRAAEASQKHAEEAQKLVEDRTLAAETTLAAANSSLEAAAADNERSLTATKLDLEKIKAEQVDAEARAVNAYQDAFVDMPEYQDLAQCLMTVGGEQLVERIMEAHPEWDLSFLRKAPAEVHVSEASLGDICGGDKGPSCADP
ncbi:putative abhydrolase domain-containing protein [Abeliophyllum distichum]|uniref:Abhydrolase domain-containing protein n=1 Tax=Abeliophyllum distichum TaxID=126358 RepID=A0ABD1TZ78_9LAMI